jgi:transposase-like protein
MKQLTGFKNLVELMVCFKSNVECLNYLKSLSWENSETPLECPHCGHTKKIYAYADKQTFRCSECDVKFNVLTNTIFENTKVPLNKWFAAIWMAGSFKRGVSSVQLSKEIGVTQKTAWFMLQRLRIMFENLAPESLEGTMCVDETYIGGKQKNKHYNKRTKGQQGRGGSEKINVFGIMEVDGKVKSKVVPDVKRETLVPIIEQYAPFGSTIMSDEWFAYRGLAKNYHHDVCDHGRYQYVSDTGATTNPIENYWSHVKRAVIGTYYHISKKHINRYLAEFDYKFNTRKETDASRFILTLQNSHGRLKYRELIS